MSRTQVETLRKNCAEFGIRLHPMGDAGQGIVHVIGPQLGLTQPGMTIVCGDSHTSTHGAFGALAFGIGTSEVEHVLATQTLPQIRPKTMAVTVDGELPDGVTAKDLILAIIAKIGTGGGQGYIIEYRGEAIRSLSMEGRMTVCNMSIEAGARAGLIAPDETTFAYLKGKPHAPKGAEWDAALEYWRSLPHRRRRDLRPRGHARRRPSSRRTSPGAPTRARRCRWRRRCPTRPPSADPDERAAAERALRYMDLTPGHRRCATSRWTRCSSARAPTAGSRTCAPRPRSCAAARSATASGCWSCPARWRSRAQAEQEGLDAVFTAAGAEWRAAGCSMCLGMNPDKLSPGERSASTSNRNFEGRQGKGGRTHLVSPEVAAATAVTGHLAAPARPD